MSKTFSIPLWNSI